MPTGQVWIRTSYLRDTKRDISNVQTSRLPAHGTTRQSHRSIGVDRCSDWHSLWNLTSSCNISQIMKFVVLTLVTINGSQRPTHSLTHTQNYQLCNCSTDKIYCTSNSKTEQLQMLPCMALYCIGVMCSKPGGGISQYLYGFFFLFLRSGFGERLQ